VKLTKTEQALMNEFATSYLGRISVTVCGTKGTRRHDAVLKLRDKGLVRFVTNYRESETHRGWSKHFLISVWEKA
jgi:hypothetical protein